MNKIMFKGVMPALTTPFDTEERLIKGSVEKQMDRCYAGGVQGFYVCGATGEGPALPVKTRMEAIEAVMAHNGGRGKIIAHIGGVNFGDVKTLIKHADECGVDAISSMAPNAYYGHNDKEMIDYYKAIASLTDKPLMVYVTPLLLGNNLTDVFEELIAVPNIIGLKFTLKDYYLLSCIKKINGGNINVINGPDEMLISGLAMGADGGIGSTYNIMPEKYAALYKAFTEGDMAKAREIQYAINDIITVLIKDGKCIPNIKAALGMMGIDMGGCAFPTKRVEGEEALLLKKNLIAAGVDAASFE